ncbi:PREDICTED: auxin response factor 9-like [Ipomoea nil]|uniref:auxin response factor 9-like n=1 Tax=Ipomoea nil TaxID=35883 RepID=UPI000900EA38|nr:PREDICTED: auxin response factor 9-like [Ipomoea nil]
MVESEPLLAIHYMLKELRVSPWEIEALVTSTPQTLQPPQRNRRAHPANLPPSVSEFSALGTWKSPVDSPQSFSYCDTSRGADLFPSPKLSSGPMVIHLAYGTLARALDMRMSEPPTDIIY